MNDTVLVSDIFYHQTKDKCTYELGPQMYIRGQGSFMTYRLIGVTLGQPIIQDVPSQSNGINNNISLIMNKMPGQIAVSAQVDTPSQDGLGVKAKLDADKSVKKSRLCSIM